MNESLSRLTDAIKAGKRKDAKAATQAALGENIPPETILDALMSGMDDVGRRFKANEIGADGFASDAASSVDLAKNLVAA